MLNKKLTQQYSNVKFGWSKANNTSREGQEIHKEYTGIFNCKKKKH